MYQEEILRAIQEQTAAINRQTEVIEKQTQSFERYARNFERVFGSGIEKEAAKIAAMTAEQRKEHNKRILAEAKAQGKLFGGKK